MLGEKIDSYSFLRGDEHQPVSYATSETIEVVAQQEPLTPQSLYTFKQPIVCCLLAGFQKRVTVDVEKGDVTLEDVTSGCAFCCSGVDCTYGDFAHTSINDVVFVEDQFAQKCYWLIKGVRAWIALLISIGLTLSPFFVVGFVSLFYTLPWAAYATGRCNNIRWCVLSPRAPVRKRGD